MNRHIKKDHQVVPGKNKRNINPLRTFHLPFSAMISLLVNLHAYDIGFKCQIV